MADLSRQKALAERLLVKVATVGQVTVRSMALDAPAPVQTAAVRVRIITRTANPDTPAKCDAVMSATAFPITGGELLLKGVTYDIVSATQSGVGSEHILQKVVLHER